MNKRSRLVILIAVLAICFAFLWPSISWYGRTPKEVQALALGSTENIKDYASVKAAEDVRAIKAIAKEDPSAKLEGQYEWLNKAAAKEYKALGEKAPKEMTVTDSAFSGPLSVTRMVATPSITDSTLPGISSPFSRTTVTDSSSDRVSVSRSRAI